MEDLLTKQIVEQLSRLPEEKKKALLEFIQTENRGHKNPKKAWKQKLLTTSVWSENDIEELRRAKEYVNTWRIRELS